MELEQAQRLFIYADWLMLAVGIFAAVSGLFFALYALFPVNRGRRKKVLLKAFAFAATFVAVLGIQASVTTAWFGQPWTPVRRVLFIAPVIALLSGLVASIYFGLRALLRDGPKQRNQTSFRFLIAISVCIIGIAPHSITMLIPIVTTEDRVKRPGTLADIGTPLPNIELTTLDGKPFRSIDSRGQVIVINFFATWCGPCQLELPQLQEVWEQFGDNDDFQMLVIGRDESDATLREFLATRDFTFPIAADPDAAIYRQFASQSIPRTFLVSKEGIVVYEWTGAYEDEMERLKRLLEDELGHRRTNHAMNRSRGQRVF